jgi:1-deoxy-D-xylulose-5-phosphate synthase
MIVSAPMNESELRNLMYTAQLENTGPFAIRYPKGRGVMPEWKTPFAELEIGKGRKLRDGEEIAVISIGHPGNFAVQACETLAARGISAAHYDMRFLKPLDEELLHDVFSKYKKVVTVEDGSIMGGLGSAVLEFMCDNGYSAQVRRLGIPDRFIEQGSNAELYGECGYDVQGIIRAIESL